MSIATDPRIKGSMRDLLKAEIKIDFAKQASREAALELQRVHDNGLYLLTHESWDAYCGQRHGICGRRGTQLLAFAGVGTNVPTVENEGQARILAGLPPEVQRRIAARAAENEDMTAEGLRDALIQLANESDELAEAVEKSRPGRTQRTPAEMVRMVLGSLNRAKKRVPGCLDVRDRLLADIDQAIRTAESASY